PAGGHRPRAAAVVDAGAAGSVHTAAGGIRLGDGGRPTRADAAGSGGTTAKLYAGVPQPKGEYGAIPVLPGSHQRRLSESVGSVQPGGSLSRQRRTAKRAGCHG